MRRSKKRILVIHPEGNIYNNPHLYEMVKLLVDRYDVRILLPRLLINAKNNEFKQYLIEYNPRFGNFFYGALYRFHRFRFANYLLQRVYLFWRRFDLIIGIDQFGLIHSSLFAKRMRTKYAFLSYEIFFKEESTEQEKYLEILAGENIEFAIVQDNQRAFHLSVEYNLPIEKIICMPVASNHALRYKKKYDLYEQLNISRDKLILLFIGSVSNWACIDQIIAQIYHWPSKWVLVLHDRYGATQEKINQLMNNCHSINEQRVFISDMQLNSTREMHNLLHCADLGLATYCPVYGNKYTGKNLEFIGLSSGKISTYLQNGVPVVTTKNSILEAMVNSGEQINFISKIDNLIDILIHFKPRQEVNDACVEFFESNLKFNLFSDNLIEQINKCF